MHVNMGVSTCVRNRIHGDDPRTSTRTKSLDSYVCAVGIEAHGGCKGADSFDVLTCPLKRNEKDISAISLVTGGLKRVAYGVPKKSLPFPASHDSLHICSHCFVPCCRELLPSWIFTLRDRFRCRPS